MDCDKENRVSLEADLSWQDDMKKWPTISEVDIFTYLVDRKACDLRQMKAYKSTAAYNYFLSECVGKVLVAESKFNHSQRFLKAESVNVSYQAWTLSNSDGTIQTGGCVCKAGNSTVCSHVAAILYKVQYAQSKGLCGENCTDKQQTWNSGTSKNVLPSQVCTTSFKRPRPNSDLEDYRKCSPVSLPQAAKKFRSADEFFAMTKNSLISNLFLVPGSLMNDTIMAPRSSGTSQLGGMFKTSHSVHSSHDFNTASNCEALN